MKSIGFPNIFKGTSTIVEEDNSTMENIKLVIGSNVRSFFGDPMFGSDLRRFLYDQNSRYLAEVVADEIAICLNEFIPQIAVSRQDITVNIDKNVMSISINCILKESGTPSVFRVSLLDADLG